MQVKTKQLAAGLLALIFTAGMIACNGKKDEKKDVPAADTTMKAPPPAPMSDTTKVDTADTRPVKTPD